MYDVGSINYMPKIKVITVKNYYNRDGKKLKCMWLYEYSVGTLRLYNKYILYVSVRKSKVYGFIKV